jgi:predicted RNA methylase
MHQIRAVIRSCRTIHDTKALIQLRPLVSSYIPLSGMSMSTAEIACICNDILINNRRRIVELGCGASTVFMAKILPEEATLHSVDHDAQWIEIVRGWLERECVADKVSFVHAPLVEFTADDHHVEWYDTAILNHMLPEHDIDCLIVDGPPAGKDASALARYPAVPFLKEKFAVNASIYLDDAVRKGEREISNRWARQLGIKFDYRLDNGGYAVGLLGKAYMD